MNMKAIHAIGYRKVIKYCFFSIWQYVFSGMFVSPLRVFILRIFGAKIGKNTVIERIRFINLYRRGLRGLHIGESCFLGDGVTLDLADEIILEDHVTLSVDTLILTHTNIGYSDHPLQKFIPSVTKPVVCKSNSFVGARAIILPGVKIGTCSAVAASALVRSDIASYTLAGGIPARALKNFRK